MPKRLRKVLAALAPLACHLAEGFLRLLPDCRGCVGFGGWRQWWHRSTRTRKVPRVSRGNNAELCPLITSHITKLIEHTRLNKSHMLKKIINARKKHHMLNTHPSICHAQTDKSHAQHKNHMLNTKKSHAQHKNHNNISNKSNTKSHAQYKNHMLKFHQCSEHTRLKQITCSTQKSHAQHTSHMKNITCSTSKHHMLKQIIMLCERASFP